MERYNLSAEHIVKLLYRKENNRVNITNTDTFFNNPIVEKVFINKGSYKISWEQIYKNEIRLKTDLPRVLKRYYHECGDFDINSCFSEILNLEDVEFSHNWLKEQLKDDDYSQEEIEKILKETDNFLIFWTENQGVWNVGIKKEDLSLENPPVYMTTNDDLYTWKKVTDDIDTFILLQIIDNLSDSKFYFLTFDSEQINSILSDKKILKESLIKNAFEIKDRKIKLSTYTEYDYTQDRVYIFKVNNDEFEKCWLIKSKVKRDKTSYVDEVLLKIAELISFNDRKIVKELEVILEDFHNYLRKNSNFNYSFDEINYLSTKEKIELKVVAMVLLLNKSGYICYLDWKCELEDFKIFFDVIKKLGIDENIYNFNSLKLNEDDDIEVWSREFNKVFSKKGIFIGNINTNSDSYSIFPTTKKSLEELRELGDKIDIKIDFLAYVEEDSMDKNWQEMYERNREKFRCKIDLDSYFTEKKIGEMEVDTLNIGEVNLPTGEILACDPLVELEDAKTFIQRVPTGKYPVKISVVPSKEYGDRYACVKVEFSKNKPVIYELAVTGVEEDMDEANENEFYGFGVDAGMGCVVDKKTQEEYIKYWEKLVEEEEADNPFDDIFDDLLTESAKKYPKYQREYGDWANWTIPNTDLNIPIFTSGWGDGYYPCYFGYDKDGELCGFYIHFIDIEREYSDEEEEE